MLDLKLGLYIERMSNTLHLILNDLKENGRLI